MLKVTSVPDKSEPECKYFFRFWLEIPVLFVSSVKSC